ncbi:MAG: AtpZ/AtpI family protein [Deltaproteobacteria bacterium]|nr:AtpZ/AtpI family protein [Deltaproteobacteria bacterium]
MRSMLPLRGSPWSRPSRSFSRTAAAFSAVGLEMGIAVAIGYLGGRWIDGRFDTAPVFSLLGLFFGLGAAFKAVWRVYTKAKSLGDDDENAQKNGES